MHTSSGLAMRVIMSSRRRLSTSRYSAFRPAAAGPGGGTAPANANDALPSARPVVTLAYTSGTKKFQ